MDHFVKQTVLSCYINNIVTLFSYLKDTYLCDNASFNTTPGDFYATMEELKNAVVKGDDTASFSLSIHHLHSILCEIAQIYQHFQRLNDEPGQLITHDALTQAIEICSPLIHHTFYITDKGLISSLRNLSDTITDISQKLRKHSSKNSSNSLLSAFEQLLPEDRSARKRVIYYLPYILSFAKAAADAKRRETFSQNHKKTFWPLGNQLAKKPLPPPILAKVIITLPQKLFTKLKTLSEALIWGKLQNPIKKASWRGWQKPVLEWSRQDIEHFLNTSGWLKLYENFTHPLSLGREEQSQKGIETIPTCNSMVTTPKTIVHLQFLTEMVLRYSLLTLEDKLSQSGNDLALSTRLKNLQRILTNFVAETPDATETSPMAGKLKAHFHDTYNYYSTFNQKNTNDHYQWQEHGQKQLLPTDIIKLLINATVIKQQDRQRLSQLLDTAQANAWRTLSGVYFTHYDLNNNVHNPVATFAAKDLTDPELKTFFLGYTLLHHCFHVVANCDYSKSTTLHTFEENRFILEILSLPKPPDSTATKSPKVNSPEIKTLLDQDNPSELQIFSAKLLSDYIEATGTHLGEMMTSSKSILVPDTLDKQIEELQNSTQFEQLYQVYKDYREQMSSPAVREKVLLSMKHVLTKSGLTYYWEKLSNMTKGWVDWTAKQDKIVLPVYMTWCLLSAKYLQDGQSLLDHATSLATHSVFDTSALSQNAYAIVQLIQNATGNSNLTNALNPEEAFNQWFNEQQTIANEAQRAVLETNGAYGATPSGIIPINVGSTIVSCITNLTQSAGWFSDQLNTMEKTYRMEKLGFITGHLPALHSEHYLAMELDPNCHHTPIYKANCGCNGKPQTCKNRCFDFTNTLHDSLSTVSTCPIKSSYWLWGQCCNVERSPLAQIAAYNFGYICCCGIMCSPCSGVLGANPHQYRLTVTQRMMGAAARTVGTMTRTVPYNTYKETLNTATKQSNYPLIGRPVVLGIDSPIALGEIANFNFLVNANETHDAANQAVAKIYSPKFLTEVDAGCIKNLYGSEPAEYLLQNQRVVKIPYHLYDKAVSYACCFTGLAGLGYSTYRTVEGAFRLFLNPLTSAIKQFGDQGLNTTLQAFDKEIKKINIVEQTVLTKVPANTAIFAFSKAARANHGKRAADPGANTQTILGNLKNGVSGPINRKLIQSGDPAAMTFGGVLDMIEGFFLDAGNSLQSLLNMLNTLPSARTAGRQMVEACLIAALKTNNPCQKFISLMKEKAGLCSAGGLIVQAEFIENHLQVEEENLRKDWLEYKKTLNSHEDHHQFLAWQLCERTQGLLNIHKDCSPPKHILRVNKHGKPAPLEVTPAFAETKDDYEAIDQIVNQFMTIDLEKPNALMPALPLLLKLYNHKGGFMRYYSNLPAVQKLTSKPKETHL